MTAISASCWTSSPYPIRRAQIMMCTSPYLTNEFACAGKPLTWEVLLYHFTLLEAATAILRDR